MGKSLSSGPSGSNDALLAGKDSNDSSFISPDVLAVREDAKGRAGRIIAYATAGALAAFAIADNLNPFRVGGAEAAPMTPGVSGELKTGKSELLVNASLGAVTDSKIDFTKLPEGIQKSMKELSDMISNGESRNLITVKGEKFMGERTGVKGIEELGKVIPFIDRKQITLGSFKQLTGFSIADLIADMKSVIGKKKPNEIEASTTGQFFKAIFADMIKNNPKMADTLTRTFENFGKKWSYDIQDGVLDEAVYAKYVQIFEELVTELERRGLLTIDTINLSNRVAGGIAYQTSLKFKEGENGEPIFTGGNANGRALQIAENKWREGRAPLASDEATRQLLMNPNSRVIVYQVDLGYDGGESNLQYLLPITDKDSIILSNQAIRHSVIGKKGKLTDIIAVAQSKQTVAGIDRSIDEIRQNLRTIKQRTLGEKKHTENLDKEIALIDQFNSLADGKQLPELKPALPKIIQIREDYAKIPGHDSSVLAQYDQTIAMLR